MPDLTVGEIKRMLQLRCPGLIHELVPDCRREGTLLCAPNPTRAGDKRGSFKIWPNGKWREFDEAYELGAGDIINLIAYVHGYPPKTTEGRRFALQWARDKLGIAGMDRRQLASVKRQASKESEAARLKSEREEQRRAWRHRLRAREIYHAAVPFLVDDDNVVTRYLGVARGIDLGAIFDLRPATLRAHARLTHWIADGRPLFPAMVAPLVDLRSGLTGVHCTFLAPDGVPAKADVTPDRLILGGMQGSIVPLTLGPGRLTVREACERGIGAPVVLCEGIETGLSIAMAIAGEARVWACLNLGNIAHAPVDLPCVSAVIVARENDTKAPAIRQAESVMDALERHGKPLSTMVSHIGVDANDLLREG